MDILIFVIALSVLVLVHEFGHFVFAKMFDVYVYEFSIGMGNIMELKLVANWWLLQDVWRGPK